MRTFVKGNAVNTYALNGVFETVVLSKYGEMLKSKISFTEAEAKRMHYNICNEIKEA